MSNSDLEKTLGELTSEDKGNIVLTEITKGVVVGVFDDKIVVRYGSGDTQFELEYEPSQLKGVRRGDEITAAVVLLRKPYEPSKALQFTEEEVKAFQDWGKNKEGGTVVL